MAIPVGLVGITRLSNGGPGVLVSALSRCGVLETPSCREAFAMSAIVSVAMQKKGGLSTHLIGKTSGKAIS
jgi:hypothetical protein